ncbi:hypothetical protein GCM10022254_09370 [Actinomadura meridiana]|uniref:Cytosine-specific methyltransferase n=1 Tax=Actinomadura meridiana TaxID=559626 RepID=A0ABP8BTQ7_9ACTN
MTALLRLGSLCSGYGGLDMAIAQVLNVEHAWVADPDPGAAAILARHWPTLPNFGDITRVDFAQVEPVDVLAAGFPCQDISNAGRRAGLDGDRSGLFFTVVEAVRLLRPRLVVLENVAALVARGLDRVTAELAALGYVGSWRCVRACDVGAPHRRDRVFIVATSAADAGRHTRPQDHPNGTAPARGGGTAPNTPGVSQRESADAPHTIAGGGHARPQSRRRGVHPPADAARDGRHEGRSEPARILRRPDAALGRDAPPDPAGLGRPDEPGHDRPGLVLTEPGTGRGDLPGRDAPRTGGDRDPASVVAWGPYGPAIDRWARVLGRPAPPPRLPSGRNGADQLNPVFVEWLMGLLCGWVTAIPGLTRNQMLKALGNGVVPQQGTAALAYLLNRIEVAA